jgi:hypothetical protein
MKNDEMVGHVARVGQEKCIESFVRKPKGKKLLGRTRNGWEDNIKMDIEKIG